MAKGLTQLFTAMGTYSDNSSRDITSMVNWSTDNSAVATIANVPGSNGVAKGVGLGSTSIIATLGSVTKGTMLTVNPPALVSIAVTPGSLTIPQGVPQQFTALGTYTDNSSQDLTATATWNSTKPAVASVTAKGVVAGVGAGTSTIQATLGPVQGSTGLTVNSAVLSEVVVSPQNPVLADTGANQAFAATGLFSDGSTQDLTTLATWTSSNPAVATVNSGGLATSLAVLGGASAGFTSIQATVGASKGVSVLSVANHTGNGFLGVFMHHNDISRTGQNINETTLTPANVNSSSFGKLFSQPVDGLVYAEPLYVANVAIPNKGTHNVIYVTTENDSVYAFDADSNTGANAAPLWHVSLIDAAHGAAPGATPGLDGNSCDALVPVIGSTSTPVIDPSTGTMYVEAESQEPEVGVQRLHALDITTGAEKQPWPVTITATIPSSGDGSSGGSLTFNPLQHLNRPGLLLVNGVVYVAFASNCDFNPYHGWIFAYDASTMSQRAVFVTTPNAGQGGIWMAGSGIAADSDANLFLSTGNGTFDIVNVPATELGDSTLKLQLRGTAFAVEDYFTPFAQASFSAQDLDLGSGGVLLLPDQPGTHAHELIQAGKWSSIYVIDRDQMTANNLHYCVPGCTDTDPQIVQELLTAVNGIFGGPAYWNSNIYYSARDDVLKMFTLTNGVLSATPSSITPNIFPYPGAYPAISANGSTNGILWAIDATQFGNNGHVMGPSVLHAYDATNVATELYNSSQAANNRDAAGNSIKFSVPTIANGKVYIGTLTELDAFGLLAPAGQSQARPAPSSSTRSTTTSPPAAQR